MRNIVITQAQIRRAVPEVNNAELDSFVASFNMFAIHFGIDNNKKVCHYLSQIFTECNALKALEENLNYSAQRLMQVFPKYFPTQALANEYAHKPERIANHVYADRYGNGGEASGDGWRYRGRGYVQLTFKDNYQAFMRCDMCHDDVVRYPEKVAKFYNNQLSAMWYWKSRGLNEIADLDDGGRIGEDIVKRITKQINGGNNGISTRLYYYRRFRKEFSI